MSRDIKDCPYNWCQEANTISCHCVIAEEQVVDLRWQGTTGKVYATEAEIKELLEYSRSRPSGIYLGKQWKCEKEVVVGGKIVRSWMLGQYLPSHKPKHYCTQFRDVVVVSEKKRDLLKQEYESKLFTYEGIDWSK